jgi:uncharacterized membrane protein YphA (DoxX/SURF4 family)
MKLREVPSRVVTGVFILHSGWDKWNGTEATAEAVHGMAAGTYPVFGSMAPTQFLRLLAAGEIATGVILLTPMVPTAVAGATLTGFAGALMGLYIRTPGLRKPGSVWPTQQGIAISKDMWLVGVGLGLIADAWSARRG